MDFASQNYQTPNSVEDFAKDFNFKKESFNNHFKDFEDLEQHIFLAFFDHTIETLEKSQDYHLFDPKNKLLSFYFTFFELLTSNREYMLYALNSHTNIIKSRERFSKLRNAFKNYIGFLDIDFLTLNQETIDNLQQKSFKETAWLQLVFTIKFWQDDDSENFEKTDVLIEKSLKATFDLINTQPIQSVIDLGKFILKEKFNFTK